MFFNGLDDKPGWTYAANYGRLTLETQLSHSVQVVVQDQVRGVDAAIVQAKRFIENGCRLIVGVHLTHR
jgi:dTDP-glucose pyrophosphorylase